MSNLDILAKFKLSLILGCNYFFNLGFMKKLGRNIRMIREIRNLTQESLAQAILAIHKSTFLELKKDKYN